MMDSLGYKLPTPTVVRRTNLNLEYLFAGSANDTSGNGRNGTVSGAALSKGRFYDSNNAYLFDGVNDYIDTNLSSDSILTKGTKTYSVWFNIKTMPTVFKAIFVKSKSIAAEGSLYLILQNGTLYFGLNATYTVPISGILANKWYHCICIKNDTTKTMTLFNVTDNVKNSTTYVGDASESSYNMFIGGWQTTGSYYINAIIDDFRIYDALLSDYDIEMLHYENDLNNVGLEAYYKFNNNVLDSSNNGYNATIVGDVTFDRGRYGDVNGAAYFGGTSNYVNTNNILLQNASAFSISCWFKTQGSGLTNSAIFYNGQTVLSIPSATNKLTFSVTNGTTTSISSVNTVTDNIWRFVVVTFNGGVLRLYINGNLQSKATAAFTSVVNNAQMWIGGGGNSYKGFIDDIRFFNGGELSNRQIKALYRLTPNKLL